jgi:hypothetical protein
MPHSFKSPQYQYHQYLNLEQHFAYHLYTLLTNPTIVDARYSLLLTQHLPIFYFFHLSIYKYTTFSSSNKLLLPSNTTSSLTSRHSCYPVEFVMAVGKVPIPITLLHTHSFLPVTRPPSIHLLFFRSLPSPVMCPICTMI